MNDILNEPSAVLRIPVDEDLPIIEEMIDSSYESVREEYEHQDNPDKDVLRKKSLCQELLAQLVQQRGTNES